MTPAPELTLAERLTRQLDTLQAEGKDNALLRFSLGKAHLETGQAKQAAAHLRLATEQNPGHSASWKLYGKALTQAGETAAACAAYRQGIAAARQNRDLQAVNEMQVFLRRLETARPDPEPPLSPK